MPEDMAKSEQLVRPLTLKGFCDHLPQEMIARNRVIETIRGVYERYGFSPIDTPVLEYLETLIGTGGEEINKEIFQLESPEGEAVGMRFDLTVPFARILAQYPDKVKLPFRRYHIGPVFRADKPGPGRYRQFTQFDIDAAGSDSVIVDAEIVAAMCDVMRELGLNSGQGDAGGSSEYQVKVNSRGLMDALLIACDIEQEDRRKHVLRVVDKLEKVGIENIGKELGEGRIDDSGDPIRGVKLAAGTIDKIVEFISVSGECRGAVVDAVRKVLGETEAAREAVDQMSELGVALDALGVGEGEAVFLPSLARGLDYYTGPVFEAVLTGAPQMGSVMGGGRYNQLAARFLDKVIPATGASIGIDRLMAGLLAIGKVGVESATTKVLVIGMRGTAAAPLKVAGELRSNGIAAEVYLGKKNVSMSKQLAYANDKGIAVAAILGSDEIESNTIALKDLAMGKEKRADIAEREQYRQSGKVGQRTVGRDEMVATVREMLRQGE